MQYGLQFDSNLCLCYTDRQTDDQYCDDDKRVCTMFLRQQPVDTTQPENIRTVHSLTTRYSKRWMFSVWQ